MYCLKNTWWLAALSMLSLCNALLANGPYVYQSLGLKSDEEIFHSMTGTKYYELELQQYPCTTFPESFWTLPVQEAALQVAEANRTNDHRQKYKIFLNSAAKNPPREMAIAFASSAPHSNKDPNVFLRASETDSYVAYASESCLDYLNPEASRFNDTAYEFGICKINDQDAKRITEALWWMNQVQTNPAGNDSDFGFFSTCGGHAAIHYIPLDGSAPLQVRGRFDGRVSETWKGTFRSEELIELSMELLYEVVPDRLGSCGRSLAVWDYKESSQTSQESQQLISHFLEMFTQDQTRISFRIVETAIRAAGDLVMTELAPQLQEINTSLPASNKSIECEDELWSDLPTASSTACAFSRIKDEIGFSLEQMQAGNDPHRLRDWVLQKSTHWQWALSRLKGVDPAAYEETLQLLLQANHTDESLYLLRLLACSNIDAAVKVAQAVPPDEMTPLAVEAFSILSQAGEAHEFATRQPQMLRYAAGFSTAYELRQEIIDALVPENHPQQWQDPQIDDALIELLNARAEDSWSIPRAQAARALFRRSGTLHLSEILALVYSPGGEDYGLFAVIERMIPEMTKVQRVFLMEWLRSNFRQPYGPINDMVMAAWSNDLRGLSPEMQSLATSSPNDVEDKNCDWISSETDTFAGGCHMARFVAMLWNEHDALTRLKLLVSFYLQYPQYFDSSEFAGALRFERLKMQISESMKKIPRNQRRKTISFLDWCDQQHRFQDYDLLYNSRRAELFTIIRQLYAM